LIEECNELLTRKKDRLRRSLKGQAGFPLEEGCQSIALNGRRRGVREAAIEMEEGASSSGEQEEGEEKMRTFHAAFRLLPLPLIFEGIVFRKIGGQLIVFAENLFGGSAFDKDIGDRTTAVSESIVGIIHSADRKFFVGHRVPPVLSGIEHVFCHQASVVLVIAVGYFVEEFLAAAVDFAASWIAAGIHAIDGGQDQVTIGAKGLFGVGAVVRAAAKFGAGAVKVTHEANIRPRLFPLFLILIGKGFLGFLSR
jgi:hypothetical protein